MRKNKFEFIIDSEFQSQIPAYSNICLHSGEKKKTADGQRISCAFLYHRLIRRF